MGHTFSTGLRDMWGLQSMCRRNANGFGFLVFTSLIFKYEQTVQLHATDKRPYSM